MPTSLQRELKKKQKYLVQLFRKSDEMPDVFGFVVAATDELVLVNHFNSEVFCLDGYDVLRQQDIHSYCFFDDPRYWRYRALRRLKIKPRVPTGISIFSIPELLSSIAGRYPLLSVHHENDDRRLTYVGKIVSMRKQSFSITDLNYYGKQTGPRRIQYEEVTRVCFDGGYLQASAMTLKV